MGRHFLPYIRTLQHSETFIPVAAIGRLCRQHCNPRGSRKSRRHIPSRVGWCFKGKRNVIHDPTLGSCSSPPSHRGSCGTIEDSRYKIIVWDVSRLESSMPIDQRTEILPPWSWRADLEANRAKRFDWFPHSTNLQSTYSSPTPS